LEHESTLLTLEKKTGGVVQDRPDASGSRKDETSDGAIPIVSKK